MRTFARFAVPLLAVAVTAPSAVAFWPLHPHWTHLHHKHHGGPGYAAGYAVGPADPFASQGIGLDIASMFLPAILDRLRIPGGGIVIAPGGSSPATDKVSKEVSDGLRKLDDGLNKRNMQLDDLMKNSKSPFKPKDGDVVPDAPV